ncbi:high mobility group box domain-containing protein [Syncephalastrum racemosum]|uniref:High mobility group box domain-containing protein n=1 Tax=Syncephalastrum racemosum TaxID=13706 RepID=A0A1X2HFK7_SYNRA|nr:high mobility group box domain-containing protein [Syncephalastrum racemosum]
MEQLSSRHGGQNGGRNLSYGLQHLVSPEAIRTAEQEEQEEAMGSSTRHPFSAFPSFLTMKHMHEQREETATSSQSGEEEGTEDAVIDDTPGYDNRDMPMMDHDEFAPAQSIVGLPIPAHSADQHDGPTSPSSSSSTTLLSTGPPEDEYPPWSRVGVVSRLGAAEAEALQSLGEIGGKEKVRERLKRPPNAYLLFNRDMRRKLLEISPKMTVAEISKEIGERWKLLSPEKRQEYIHEAAMIKQDHLKNHPDFIYTRRSKAQLAEARKLRKSRTEPRKKMVTKPSHSNTRRSPQPGGPRDPRGRKKKRHRHPTAPKHPMSGFLFFLAAVRPHVARQLPGSTVGPISKVIASQWRDMSEEDRLPWLQKAEEDKARYAREMRVYTSQQEAQRDLDDGSVAAVMQMVSSEQTYGYDAPDHGLMNVASSTSSSHITTSSYMYPNSAAAAHPSPPVHLSVASGVPTSNSMA